MARLVATHQRCTADRTAARTDRVVTGGVSESVIRKTNDIHVDAENGSIDLSQGIEVPYNEAGRQALGYALDVPVKFLDRLPRDMQSYVVNELLTRNPHDARISFTDGGIESITEPVPRFIPSIQWT